MENRYNNVHTLRDLAQFGINALTGEACVYSMRMLCDVNEEGKALIGEYFGMPELVMPRNMNSEVNGKPSVGCFMLPHGMLQSLAQFAFFMNGAIAVVVTPTEVIGVFDEARLKQYRELAEQYPNSGYSIRVNPAQYSSAPMQGSRNVHTATGRVH